MHYRDILKRYEFGMQYAPTVYELVNQYGFDWNDNLKDYPIWDETKREWLNTNLYNYFCYREIAQETGASFFRWMNLKLGQIMPQVNAIASFTLGDSAASADWETTGTVTADSTENVTQDTAENMTGTSNTTTTEDGKNTETVNSASEQTMSDTTTANSASKASALNSNTPQVRLSNEKNYMSALNETGSESESTGTDNRTDKGTTNATTTGTTDIDGTSKTDTSADTTKNMKQASTGVVTTTAKEGQLAARAAAWLEAVPDILGIIYAACESCFVQVWE